MWRTLAREAAPLCEGLDQGGPDGGEGDLQPGPGELRQGGRHSQHVNCLHTSRYSALLSLVESSRVLKYFHAPKGPVIGALSDATPAVLCHKEPARRKNTPY